MQCFSLLYQSYRSEVGDHSSEIGKPVFICHLCQNSMFHETTAIGYHHCSTGCMVYLSRQSVAKIIIKYSPKKRRQVSFLLAT